MSTSDSTRTFVASGRVITQEWDGLCWVTRSDVARTVMIGGYGHTLRPATAGRFGCDPCFFCCRRPAAGAPIWHTCYGDVVCDNCSVAS